MILEQRNSPTSHHSFSALMLVLILAGCASTTDLEVDLSQEFPSPLVVPAPVHMGIYVPQEFEQYVFQEFENIPQKPAKSKKKKPKKKQATKQKSDKQTTAGEQQSQASAEQASSLEQEAKETDGAEVADKSTAGTEQDAQAKEKTAATEQEEKEKSKPKVQQRLKMRVALGDAQARMIRSVLPPVFENATLLDSLAVESRPSTMDLYVVPEIKRLQYTTPKSTRTKVYEIWLQYDFVIYDRNDDVVTRWNLPCYGKTPSVMMKSQKDALQAATQMALRDCGAAFSTGFNVHPAVQRWMQGEEQRKQRTLGRVEANEYAE